MKRKWFKTVALLMTLALLTGFAFAEQAPETANVELDSATQESTGGTGTDAEEVDGAEAVEETPVELDELELPVGSPDPVCDAIYRFIVEGGEYACQVARAGEEILRPEDPDAPEGTVFAGWTRMDGTPLFVDADGNGEIDPVTVKEDELGTEVYVWAGFSALEPVDQPAEPSPEEPADQPAEASPEEPVDQPAEASPEESVDQPTDAPQKPSPDGEGGAAAPEEVPSADGVNAEESVDQPVEASPEENLDQPTDVPQKPSPDGEGGAAAPEEVPSADGANAAETGEEETTSAAPAEGPLVLPTANALTYTGEAQALVTGEGWLYSLDGETFDAEIPAAVNAGEYTVYFKAAEADEARTITVTVAKADVVFIAPVAAAGEQGTDRE